MPLSDQTTVFDKLLHIRDVLAATSLSRTGLYSLIGQGKFPQPVKVGGRSAWRASDVQRWIESLEPKKANMAD